LRYDTAADDSRRMWQSQRREHVIMSIEEVRFKAQTVQTAVRRNVIVALMFGALLLALCTLVIVTLPNTPARLIAAAIMALTLLLAFKAYDRIWPVHTLSPDAALKGCIEFYRKELQAQYSSLALTWRFLVPIVVFAFMTWNAVLRTNPLIPKILSPSVLVLILLLRRREARNLRRKLAELEEFERGASQ